MSSQLKFEDYLIDEKGMRPDQITGVFRNLRELWEKYKDEYCEYCSCNDFSEEDLTTEFAIDDQEERESRIREYLEKELGREPTEKEVEAIYEKEIEVEQAKKLADYEKENMERE